ncbi:MAG: aromatic amino acid ammonia-lyase [Myxococcota bacterium]|nr:aromatic amino acid ammonia-lyase [Myxococcota bacterium]
MMSTLMDADSNLTMTGGLAVRSRILLGRDRLSIDEVLAVAHGRARVELDSSPEVQKRLQASHAAVEKLRLSGSSLYGVTTGVGASVNNEIPEDLHAELPLNLLRFHGCGTGRLLDDVEATAVLVARAASLARGFSGVRPLLIERLCELANRRILPCIPAEGSVGASGDLTPLSYVASLLVGEREARVNGEMIPAAEALAAQGLEPIALEPKESLAIMNGTSVMSALACLAFDSSLTLARAACAITAVASDTTLGNPGHFDERIALAKPHPGQLLATRWIAEDLALDADAPRVSPARVQDRYSIRCAPQIVGVLLDALRHAREMIEIELTAANDNPLIDPETGDSLHGGNFYGGHLCFAMDSVKSAVASVADMLDRQLVLLCAPETSGGLPENLVARSGRDRVVHHGFKAMQITASALTAEAQKLSSPASAFSRSTESHNQDKVSMGSIAVRVCLRIVELTETVSAISILAVVQAVDLRGETASAARSRALHEAVRKTVELNSADRRQDRDIENILERLRSRDLPLGDIAVAALDANTARG